MLGQDDLKHSSPLYYASTLFAPSDRRDALQTLYRWDGEIKRIPSLVSEPMLGQIRLQWWREALNGERPGEAQLHPLAHTVLALIKNYGLPLKAFDYLIDGELALLDTIPYIDQRDIERHYGQRFSTLFQLAALILGHNLSSTLVDACGYSGIAYGIASDVLSGRHNVTRDELVELGMEHLQKARLAIDSLPEEGRSAFLPLVLVEPVLTVSRHLRPDHSVAMPSYLRLLWRMLWFKI